MRVPFKQRKRSELAAFTLVELLVAMSILVLLLAMVTQLVSSASQVTIQSSKRLDADTQARMLFDRMAIDFANIVKRPDVDTLFYKATGNDKMFFFAQAPAYYDSAINATAKSNFALVGYRVTDQNGDAANFASAYSLERLGKGLAWSGTPSGSTAPGSVVFASGTATPTNTLPGNWGTDIGSAAPYTGTSDFYHVVANQVLRMEVCFQVKDLTNPNATSVAYSNFPVAVKTGATNYGPGVPPNSGQPGDRWYDTTNNRAYRCTSGTGSSTVWQLNGIKDVASVVVTIVVLDNGSRKITSNLTTLAGLFLDADETNDLRATPAKLPAQVWKVALETALKNNIAGIPKAAAAQIRIYQRHFSLNSNNTK